MQYAASIKYGGLLVNASECDYEAFRNLGLTCPHCHESVFLVPGHERHYQKTSKVTEVASHFCHRPDKNKDAIALCELRSRQITSTEIQRRETKSKNQRLQLFNRHLWNILLTCYKLKHFEEKKQSLDNGFWSVCKSEPNATVVKNAYKDFLIGHISSYSGSIISEADFFFSDLMKKISDEKLVLQEDLKAILTLWRQQIDAKMQVEIYKEAVTCLLQKKHLPILEKLMFASLSNLVTITALSVDLNLGDSDRLQIYNSFFTGEISLNKETELDVYQTLVEAMLTQDSERLSAVYHFVRDDVLETIAFTPWAEGFEKFSS
jgi:hypothetical protein